RAQWPSHAPDGTVPAALRATRSVAVTRSPVPNISMGRLLWLNDAFEQFSDSLGLLDHAPAMCEIALSLSFTVNCLLSTVN
ncbi:MAG: hypothetical protein FWH52_07235, partial [Synergistaceae bacterium]|nr:hypothetical protein [Synergistaceae bacterium]